MMTTSTYLKSNDKIIPAFLSSNNATKIILILSLMTRNCVSFTTPHNILHTTSRTTSALHASTKKNNLDTPLHIRQIQNVKTVVAGLALATTLTLSPLAQTTTPLAAHAASYDPADETVSSVIKRLESAAGNPQESQNAFEEVAQIITEGKGVGGDVSYGGVQLNRGEVSGEDTTIYNPGLSLLTESEKKRIIAAVVKNKKIGTSQNSWTTDNQYAYDFLKQKIDPLHMVELKGYLGIFPFYAAGVYLAALAVQQNARDFFVVAYIFGAVLVFGPVVALLAIGV